MARVTVEDCLDKIPNRFDLVLMAAARAKSIAAGDPPRVLRSNDKNSVVALREIAEIAITEDELIENVMKGLCPALKQAQNDDTYSSEGFQGVMFSDVSHESEDSEEPEDLDEEEIEP